MYRHILFSKINLVHIVYGRKLSNFHYCMAMVLSNIYLILYFNNTLLRFLRSVSINITLYNKY